MNETTDHPTLMMLDDGSHIIVTSLGRESWSGMDGGRILYRWAVMAADGSQVGTADDLRSGCGAQADTVEGMRSLLSFMGAQAEAISYGTRTGHESENADLFAPIVAEWIVEHENELGSLACDLEGEDA